MKYLVYDELPETIQAVVPRNKFEKAFTRIDGVIAIKTTIDGTWDKYYRTESGAWQYLNIKPNRS